MNLQKEPFKGTEEFEALESELKPFGLMTRTQAVNSLGGGCYEAYLHRFKQEMIRQGRLK